MLCYPADDNVTGAMRRHGFMTNRGIGAIAVLWGVLLQAANVWAESLIDPFVGRYLGHAEYMEGTSQIERDLGVTISKHKKGFNVSWKVSTLKPSGKVKVKEYSIDFVPTHRENVFMSAMKTNVFGRDIPLDPIKGEPYVWARIIGDTLTLFALHINDDGGYELQVYNRTLAPNGLDLEYLRIRDGEPLRTIKTVLTRLDNN